MKKFNGSVISNKMSKTVIVEVLRRSVHPLYKKVLLRSKRYKVHADGIIPNLGDIVEIVETRPISKDKYFKVSKILSGKRKNKNEEKEEQKNQLLKKKRPERLLKKGVKNDTT